MSLVKEPHLIRDSLGALLHHLSSRNGWLDVTKDLITNYHFDPQERPFHGETCLHYAAESNHVDVVRYLITECNCDPMTTDFNGSTVLHSAAAHGSFDVMKYLINHHNCIPMASNHQGETILHCAVEHTEVVKYLINEFSFDPMTVNDDKDTVLHYAAKKGLIEVLKFMINHHNCNLMATNKRDETILHCAVEHTEVAMYLIFECNFDPMTVINNDGDTVLHYAATKGLLEMLKFMINHHNCNLMATNKRDETILHRAVEHTEVVMYLIIECNFDPMTVINNDGDTVLHYAATKGLLEMLKFMINYHNCNLMATNKRDETILHRAVEHTEVVMYLIIECNFDPMTVINNDGDTVLHYAATKGLLEMLKFMTNHHHCNLMATNKRDETILHRAVEHTEVVKYLIIRYNYDPMVADKDGWTLLHTATFLQIPATVEYLLSTGRCDPLAKDNMGKTPLQLSRQHTNICSIFKKFGQIKVSHPVDSYVNVLLLGNPGAGKSTLSHVITDTATGSIAFGSFRNVKGVEPCTAGIFPYKLQHKTLGNIILHDFAGHPEYYSSHSAVIENLLQGSGGVFLIVVNILEKEAVKQLHQWLTVVRNEAEKALDQCHIIVVVSHVDELSNSIERRKREEEIQEIIRRERCDSIYLDCRKLGGSGIGSFFNKLSIACESIRSTSERNLSLYCHMMYFLLEERKENILTLSDVMSAAKDNNSYVLPDKREENIELLCSLDSTGLINVLQSEDKVWVVVNKGILLAELDGILFAPKDFKEHVDIASNTGIVSVTDLTRLFPHYESDMLICFLKKMELCQEMNPSFLSMTNLFSLNVKEDEAEGEVQEGRGDVKLLFFPCLFHSDRPDEMTSKVYQFGWCLQCTAEHDYFPPRYFHVLSLHLAYKLAHPQEDDKLNRRCTFWRNGLYWLNGDGVGVLVEIVDESQCVLVLMSQKKGCSDIAHLRRNVIREILLTRKESCPSLGVKEFIIDPEELSYPVKTPRERTLHSVKDVISCILSKQDYIVNATGTRAVELKSILTDESSDINNLSLLGGRDIMVKNIKIIF